MADLISRAAALDVLVTSPNFHTTLTRIEELPAVDAIPVEWMREKMLRPQMTDGNPFGFVLAKWLEEQEEEK